MSNPSLSARPRTAVGRHAAGLRRTGSLPAVVYGHGVPSQPIELDGKSLERIWSRAGTTTLVDLDIEGQGVRRVLFRQLQISPLTGRAIHADFYAPNLTERTVANVPVVLTGESPAVALKLGTVLQAAQTIRIEALPTDLPSQLNGDLEVLVGIDSVITAGDIPLPPNVTLLSDAGEVVAKISGRRAKGSAAAAADADDEADAAATTASGAGATEPTAGDES